MQFPPEMVKRLCSDKEFQTRIDADEALDACMSQRDITREDEVMELLTVLGGNAFVSGNVPVKPPTPGVISMLAIVNSPFLSKPKEITPEDVDKAMYILIHRRDAFDKIDLDANFADETKNFCALLGLDYGSATLAILKLLRIGFLAFDMLPDVPEDTEKKIRFDADWISYIVRGVSDVSHYTPEQILWDVPMTTCGYLCVQSMKKAGIKGICRRSKTEKTMQRLTDLMQERINEYAAEDLKKNNMRAA